MPKSKFLRSVFKVIFNKYFIASTIFLVAIVFFDDFNLIKRWQVNKENKKLEQDLKYYQDEIDKNKQLIMKLKTDTAYLEKYAREKYHLKKKNEDVFIVE